MVVSNTKALLWWQNMSWPVTEFTRTVVRSRNKNIDMKIWQERVTLQLITFPNILSFLIIYMQQGLDLQGYINMCECMYVKIWFYKLLYYQACCQFFKKIYVHKKYIKLYIIVSFLFWCLAFNNIRDIFFHSHNHVHVLLITLTFQSPIS